MVCIYYQYKEYKEGAIRPNAAPDLVKFPYSIFQRPKIWWKTHAILKVLFEPSSEVATARFSSVRRKSLTDSLFRWENNQPYFGSLFKHLKLVTTPSKTDFQLQNRKSRTMSPLVSSKRASLSRICEEESGNQCLSSDR